LITLNDAPQSVRLLWKSDQLVAETSTWQHTTNIHASGGIRTHDRSRRAAVDLRAAIWTGNTILPSKNIFGFGYNVSTLYWVITFAIFTTYVQYCKLHGIPVGT
jgi:hypothetical protein